MSDFLRLSPDTLARIRNNIAKREKIEGPLVPADVITLFNVLKDNTSLTFLDFDGCALGDEGCKHLKTFLASNKTIRKLDLNCNNITSDGCKLLAEGLQNNPESTLEVIYLLTNIVDSSDIERLEGAKDGLVIKHDAKLPRKVNMEPSKAGHRKSQRIAQNSAESEGLVAKRYRLNHSKSTEAINEDIATGDSINLVSPSKDSDAPAAAPPASIPAVVPPEVATDVNNGLYFKMMQAVANERRAEKISFEDEERIFGALNNSPTSPAAHRVTYAKLIEVCLVQSE